MWVLKTMYQFNTVYVPSSVEFPIQQKYNDKRKFQ